MQTRRSQRAGDLRKNTLKHFASFRKIILARVNDLKNKTLPEVKTFIRKHPMASFFISLAALFFIIALNSFLTPSPKETVATRQIKEVSVYRVGAVPKVSFSGKIEKEGVVQIVAQAPGIVSSINVYPGQEILRGTVLLNIANNYTGGSAAGVGVQLAAAQYQNIIDTYDKQKSVIEGQRRIASENLDNTQLQRDIISQSVSETHDLITLNASVIVSLESNLKNLEATNVGGVNDDAILSAKSLLVQARSANNGLYQAVRNEEVQAASDSPQAALSGLSHNIAMDQLDIQEKALNLSREASRLQLEIAQISYSAMNPASPFDGTVERVNVVSGQSVNPGTILATITGASQKATVVVRVPKNVAHNISQLEPANLTINGKNYSLTPQYVSKDATDGILNSVTFTLPQDVVDEAGDNSYVKVDIPIGYPDTLSSIPFVPIDIVFQTQNGAFIYIEENGKAKSREVALGNVVGADVEIKNGLSAGDNVILDRSVIEGESVKVKN